MAGRAQAISPFHVKQSKDERLRRRTTEAAPDETLKFWARVLALWPTLDQGGDRDRP